MKGASKLFVVGVCLLASFALGNSPAESQVSFADVSVSSGVDDDLTTYESPNIHSLGPNWIDFDNDGDPDLFAVRGDDDRPAKLFENNGDGTFTDVSSYLGTPIVVEMSGSIFADYDNDGDSDIYVYTDNRILDTVGVNPPDGPANLLFKNLWVESGQKMPASGVLFEEVAALANVQDLPATPFGPLPGYRTKAAAFLDYNRDGCIDLFVGHWVMKRGGDSWNRDRLYKNNCEGGFYNVTNSSGLNDGTDPTTFRPTLAAVAGHFDDDLWPDIYAVTGTPEAQPLSNDFLYKNNGDGTLGNVFVEPTDLGDDAMAGMGLDIADVDLDGDWDVYITDLAQTAHDDQPRRNVMYKGDGAGSFFDNSIVADGVEGDNSWGTNFFDIDHDGYEDLYVGCMQSVAASFVYMNDQDGSFTDVWATSGIGHINARGSAVADFDGDGDVDLSVVNQIGPLRLYENNTPPVGDALTVRPLATISNKDAIGTVIKATIGGTTRMRQIKGGTSGHGQDANVAYFGLGTAATVDEIKIYWPSGLVDTLTNVATNKEINVVEGSTSSHLWWGFDSAGGDYYQSDSVLALDLFHSAGASGALGGKAKTFTFAVANTDDDVLYQSMRQGPSFGYQVDNLPAGDYQLDLLFAEPYFNAPGRRAMDITVEGALAVDNLDVAAEAGGRRIAHVETVVANVADGSLDLDIAADLSNRAFVSGVKLRRLAFQMNSGGGLDEEAVVGFLFPDAEHGAAAFGYSGGSAFEFEHEITNTEDDAVYNAVRAGGSFSYRVSDLPSGTYEVEFLFMEPQKNAAGLRTVDVTLEGALLLDDFDIFVAAGGRRIAHQETVSIPVTDGQLDIDFAVAAGGKAIVSGLSIRRIGDA